MKKILFSICLAVLCFGSKAQSTKTEDTFASNKMMPVKGTLPDSAVSIEHYPEYPGGQAALLKFISDNIRYPKKARKQGVKGRVVTKFVIDKDGSIINAEVVRGIGGGCDEEALRVINAMPKWKPGYVDGKPVKVYYTLPIRFDLQD